MGRNLRRSGRTLALASVLIGLGTLAFSSPGDAGTRGCASFKAQADAQDYFISLGGRPGRGIGKLDEDRDGVACEGLKGPYKGFATIGYNRRKQFLYGVATMPLDATGNGEYACLNGNGHFPDAPRRLNVFRVRPGADKPLLGKAGDAAAAMPASGKLIWKVGRKLSVPGRYYVEFEAMIRTSPYGRSQCPAFDSRATPLPKG